MCAGRLTVCVFSMSTLPELERERILNERFEKRQELQERKAALKQSAAGKRVVLYGGVGADGRCCCSQDEEYGHACAEVGAVAGECLE